MSIDLLNAGVTNKLCEDLIEITHKGRELLIYLTTLKCSDITFKTLEIYSQVSLIVFERKFLRLNQA
jgi:hypothetical protein